MLYAISAFLSSDKKGANVREKKRSRKMEGLHREGVIYFGVSSPRVPALSCSTEGRRKEAGGFHRASSPGSMSRCLLEPSESLRLCFRSNLPGAATQIGIQQVLRPN